MNMIAALMDQARRRPRPAETAVLQWVWECQRCPGITSIPCSTEAEAAFLGRQHDIAHHGIPLGMPSGGLVTRPHRLGMPDTDAGLQAEGGLQASAPTSRLHKLLTTENR